MESQLQRFFGELFLRVSNELPALITLASRLIDAETRSQYISIYYHCADIDFESGVAVLLGTRVLTSPSSREGTQLSSCILAWNEKGESESYYMYRAATPNGVDDPTNSFSNLRIESIQTEGPMVTVSVRAFWTKESSEAQSKICCFGLKA